MEHPLMEADVVIVGAGPAGLACALHLANLIDRHNSAITSSATGPGVQPLSKENIYVLEKGRELGAHMLSGAVMDPRGLRELVPDFEKDAPLAAEVHDDAAYLLSHGSAFRFPITPPPLRNHGNYIISLNQLVRWLGSKVEAAGITIFTSFAGKDLLFGDDARVVGVRTEDKGIDKQGQHKSNFEPGYDLKSRITVLAEGPRGSLTKQLTGRLGVKADNPQVYSLGVKEIWELPAGRFPVGRVYHTMGWPLASDMYGGGWIYGLPDNRVSIGLVTGLEYRDPRTDPHELFQKFKTHEWIRGLLDGGEMRRYGAKTIPMGGWYSIPPSSGAGWMVIGDSAGYLNAQRLKGIHLAMKSGMLAAESVFEALRTGNDAPFADFPQRVERSWIRSELWKVRNFHQGFEHGLWSGLVHGALQMVTGGRGIHERYSSRAGHERMRRLDELGPAPERMRKDGRLTFDKLADVYHSGTRHEEDQPPHLLIHDTDICNERCIREYGNPCQYFCPANVYEMVDGADGTRQIHLNPSNCVHCKTCDIMDPYEIITWVPPEGGGGPNYEGM